MQQPASPDMSMSTTPPQPAYAELHCISNFTFLRGASHPHELVEQADALGYSALAWDRRRCMAFHCVRNTVRKAPGL